CNLCVIRTSRGRTERLPGAFPAPKRRACVTTWRVLMRDLTFDEISSVDGAGWGDGVAVGGAIGGGLGAASAAGGGSAAVATAAAAGAAVGAAVVGSFAVGWIIGTFIYENVIS